VAGTGLAVGLSAAAVSVGTTIVGMLSLVRVGVSAAAVGDGVLAVGAAQLTHSSAITQMEVM
jgi:hypothetical protein